MGPCPCTHQREQPLLWKDRPITAMRTTTTLPCSSCEVTMRLSIDPGLLSVAPGDRYLFRVQFAAFEFEESQHAIRTLDADKNNSKFLHPDFMISGRKTSLRHRSWQRYLKH